MIKLKTAEEQRLEDDATIFVLAQTMIHVVQSFSAEDHAKTAIIINQTALVIQSDPTFLDRFRGLHASVMEEFQKVLARKKRILIDL